MKPQEIIDLLMECRGLRDLSLDAFFDRDVHVRIEKIQIVAGIHDRIDAVIEQLEQENRE